MAAAPACAAPVAPACPCALAWAAPVVVAVAPEAWAGAAATLRFLGAADADAGRAGAPEAGAARRTSVTTREGKPLASLTSRNATMTLSPGRRAIPAVTSRPAVTRTR